MSDAALAHVRAEHDVESVAERYVAALELAAGSDAVETKILQSVAAAAADTGVAPEAVAPELAELGLATSNGHRPAVAPAGARAATWPRWLWLATLYVVAVAVQLGLGLRLVSPWIMVDELIYSDMARSFANTGHFLIRGAHADYGFVYPLLLSPFYAAFSAISDVYEWARLVNALAMCSVVFPAYLLARRVVRPGYAFTVAALSIAVPSTIYVGTLMTENAFYPIFVWFSYALVLALERPTLRRQAAVLLLAALAFLTRAQAVALVAAALTAPLLLAWIERGRPRRLREWKPLYATVVAAGVLAIVVEAARGRSPSQLLGGYSVTTEHASYGLWSSLRWILYHFAALDLSLFVLPFAALIVLVANARHLDAALRAFAAGACALVVWLTLEVGVFASHWSQRIEERNLFYLAPLFLVALLAWIERGRPSPPRAVVAAAGISAALPGAIPFLRLMNINAQSDTPFLQPWWYLGDRVAGRENVALIAVAAAVVLAALFLWLPGRYAPLLPALVALGFFLTWLPLELWIHSFPRLSSATYTTGIGTPHKSWIDRAVGPNADVTIVWTGNDPYRGWLNEFWNRSVKHAYDLGSDTLIAGNDEPHLTVQSSTGFLLDPQGKQVHVEYALADPSAQIDGKPVASDPDRSFVLYRVNGALRTSTSISGWHGDMWTGATFSWLRRGCVRGDLRVPVRTDPVLFSDTVQHIAVSGSTQHPFTVTLPSTASKTIDVPLVPQGGVCRVSFAVSPTRRPADYPTLANPDPRQLGVLVSGFQYEPAAGA
jgi:hypothetical protein